MGKTSYSIDERTQADIAALAAEDGMSQGAYLAELVRRDKRRRGMAADSVVLAAAGHTPERASALAARLVAARRAGR